MIIIVTSGRGGRGDRAGHFPQPSWANIYFPPVLGEAAPRSSTGAPLYYVCMYIYIYI